MKILGTIFIWTLILISSSAHADSEKNVTPSPKPIGDLALTIVASASPDFINQWLKTSPEKPVTIKRLKKAKPNQLIVSAFLVSGLSADSKGNYNFSVSFTLCDQNGKTMFEQNDYAKGKGVLPSFPTFIMGNPALDITFENSDPAGLYLLTGIVTDLVNQKTATDRYIIILEK
jgi:hypothetical protein